VTVARHVAKTVLLVGALGPTALLGRLSVQGASSVHVCVSVDRVLRFSSGNSCPAGQASYNLALDGTQPSPPDEDKTVSNQIGELKKTVEFLKDRVLNLEKELAKADKNESSLDHIIHAPFHVVDKSGKPILTVTESPSTQATGRVVIGRGSGDNYGLWLANASGTPVAGVLESKPGAGAVVAYDQAGKRHVQMNGGGGFDLFNSVDQRVVAIGINAESPTRGFLELSGSFTILNTVGQVVIKAGQTLAGTGEVQTGPGWKCVPYAGLRVPDCIKGLP